MNDRQKTIIGLGIVIIGAALATAIIQVRSEQKNQNGGASSASSISVPPDQSSVSSSSPEGGSETVTTDTPAIVAEDLEIPWDIVFLPNEEMLVTQRTGTVLRIGRDRRSYPIAGVRAIGEGGLLGMALHPKFTENKWLYLYFTTEANGARENRIERYRFESDELTEETHILTGIPAAANHDGGRIAFGPDGYLYVTTGDAQNENSAQDTASLAGKILRITEDGSIPTDNPFGNAVYSYGHRNPQGITWDDQGRLWSTEHGRSGY